MKKLLCLVTALFVFISVFFSGCQNIENNSEQEQILVYLPEDSYLAEVIRKYNRYLIDENYENKYKIKVKYFDSADENTSVTKMVTEIMAGAGPDLIALETDIPFEKLMQQNIFADINEMINDDKSEDKLDLSVYNKAIMDSCVVDGKRLMIPLAFSINANTVSDEMCSQYNIPLDKNLTYSNAADILNDFLDKAHENDSLTVFSSIKNQLLNLIDDYVDFGEGKVYFNTPEFKQDFKQLSKLITKFNKKHSNYSSHKYYNFNFEDFPNALFNPVFEFGSGVDVFRGMDSYELFNGINKTETTIKATVKYAFAVNNNSKKKNEVLNFIKYALSKHIQAGWMAGYLPVNNDSFALKLYYSMLEAGMYNPDDAYASKSKEFIEKFLELLKGVNDCNIPNTYYHNNIIGGIVEDYIAGKITEQKFLNQLNSKTKIFVNE